MTIQEKYDLARPYIEHGDVLFFRGKSFLAKGIQWADNAYYNHVGMIKQDSDRLLILDAWTKGIGQVALSDRINDYDGGDFCILKFNLPYKVRDRGIKWCTNQIGYNRGYDHFTILRQLLALKAGIDIKLIGNPNKYICSEFFQEYTKQLGLKNYESSGLITPQDGIRYMDINISMLIFNSEDMNLYPKPSFRNNK